MCAVSAVMDYYANPHKYPHAPKIDTMDMTQINLLREVIQRLDELDKKLEDRDCNDPAKQKFEKKISKRIRELRQDKTT